MTDVAETTDPILVAYPRSQIAVITLNEPATLNALTPAMIARLSEELDHLAVDETVRVVVITGAGRGFCSGHGLDDLSEAGEHSEDLRGQLAGQRRFSGLIAQINDLPQPVIAAVNGAAAGAGLAIALAADTRVCSPSARFMSAFIRVGISGCDVGVSYLLPRIVSPTLAFEMMLTGRLVGAEEARASGLVLSIAPEGGVVDAALAIADQIIGNSPFGVQMTKRAMWHALDSPSLRHTIELEDRTQALCLQIGDGPTAIAAVRSKQPVDWTTTPNYATK